MTSRSAPTRTSPARRRRTLAVALVAPALALAGCGGAASQEGASAGSGGASQGAGASEGSGTSGTATTVTGEGPLDFTAATVDGGELDAATLAGRPTVLWFWAPWCPTCQKEAPEVADVARALDGEVDVVGVAGLGERAAMQTFVEQGGVEGLTHVDDVDGQVWARFGVASQPAFAFVSTDGDVEVVPGSMGADALRERAAAMVG